MFLVNGMTLESMFAALILSSWAVPQGDVGEDLHDATETRTLGIRLRSDQIAPSLVSDSRASWSIDVRSALVHAAAISCP